MPFEKGHSEIEPVFTQADVETIWERYFGKRHSLAHIAHDYDTRHNHIAAIIDAESARRWHTQHPEETNQKRASI